jgi:hypothetical protein
MEGSKQCFTTPLLNCRIPDFFRQFQQLMPPPRVDSSAGLANHSVFTTAHFSTVPIEPRKYNLSRPQDKATPGATRCIALVA